MNTDSSGRHQPVGAVCFPPHTDDSRNAPDARRRELFTGKTVPYQRTDRKTAGPLAETAEVRTADDLDAVDNGQDVSLFRGPPVSGTAPRSALKKEP
jgi:hypothetical protein